MDDYSPYPVSVGQVVEFYDTPGTRRAKAWYFERNYHHYLYTVVRIVGREGYNLVISTVLQKKKGLDGTEYLDNSIETGYTANISSATLKPVDMSNRMYIHVLTKFEED